MGVRDGLEGAIWGVRTGGFRGGEVRGRGQGTDLTGAQLDRTSSARNWARWQWVSDVDEDDARAFVSIRVAKGAGRQRPNGARVLLHFRDGQSSRT